MKPLTVRFGIELEFIGPGTKYLRHLFHKKFNQSVDDDGHKDAFKTWSIGTDPSVFESREHEFVREERFGMELRSPIMEEKNIRKIKPVVDLLAPVCFVGKSCGMHLHLSCPQDDVHVELQELSEAVYKRYGKQIWSQRRRYCRKGTSVDRDGQEPKYHVVRKLSGNHVEVRIFNGTLDYLEILKRIRYTCHQYRRSLRRLVPDNPWVVEDGFGRCLSSPYRRIASDCKDVVYDERGSLVAIVVPTLPSRIHVRSPDPSPAVSQSPIDEVPTRDRVRPNLDFPFGDVSRILGDVSRIPILSPVVSPVPADPFYGNSIPDFSASIRDRGVIVGRRAEP